MEEEKVIGNLKERVKLILKNLEECKSEKERLKREIEGLKRKYAETLKELEELKALIDSVLDNET